ncbi:MAG: helix-turn-helix transcriptional regulator [Clostridiales bacterium]|nr:helix-turn-helix transcriptional regulator [Clostridiales bacterium]
MLKDNLIAARLKKNYTQQQVADHLNMKRQSYGAYERGVSIPDAKTLQILADYFDVSVDYLLRRDNSEDPPEIPEEDIKFALFGGVNNLTDEMYEEVLEFVEFVKQKYAKKQIKGSSVPPKGKDE